MNSAIEKGLYSIFSTAAAITQIASDRTYFGLAPQNMRKPRLVLVLVSEDRFPTFGGDAPVSLWTVQIDCLSNSHETTKQLEDAVKDVFKAVKNTVAGETTFRYCRLTSREDIPMMPLEGKAEATYGVSLTMQCMVDTDY